MIALLCAVVVTAATAWLSQGTLAFLGTGRERIAVLPVSPAAVLVISGVVACVWLASRRRALLPLALSVLLLLPWLPGAPAAFHVWTGPIALFVWTAIAVSLLPSSVYGWLYRRPLPMAGVLAAVVYGVAAWQTTSLRPGGDEPHYLIITQSLLADHDLRIENNHRRGDYLAYFRGELRPDFRRRGRDGEIYSIHAPGVPVLIAPAFALAGYQGVVVFLILFSSMGSALAWHLAWRVTRDPGAAWFGWAAVTLSTTNVFQSFAVFPDGPGAVVVLTGIWALLRSQDEAENGSERAGPWLLHGAALAALPWMHARLAVTAGSLGALVLLRLARTRNAAAKAVAFLAVPAVSALCWMGYFIAVYGTPDPAAPFGDEIQSIAFIPGAIVGLLFDQRFGLLAYAPVLVFAFGGLGVMVKDPAHRRLGLELLFVMTPYLLVVTHVAMWWGGASAPARFMAPVLLMLAVPAARAWQAVTSRATRVTAGGALVFTVFATAVLVFVEGGRLAYNRRETYAYWLEWLTGSADLMHGLPSWWRDNEAALFRDVAIWSVALAAAWTFLRAVEGRPWLRVRGALSAVAGAAYAVAAMVALTAVWRLSGVDGIVPMPAQLQVLRRISSEPHLVSVGLEPLRRISSAATPSLLRIEPPPALEPGAAGRNDRPLFALPAIPAGRYRLHPRMAGAGGWLMVGVGSDQFALRTQPIGMPPEPIVLDLPVNVRAIVVKGDEQTRRAMRGLTVEPLSVVPPASRLTSDTAARAVRYGTSTVFFLDDRSFPEPEAFWVGGGRQSTIVIQPDSAAPSVALFVRNAPVENSVSIESGTWHTQLTLGPGEERRLDVPRDANRGAALLKISASAGFRPSAVDPKSRDNRFLGVWVRID